MGKILFDTATTINGWIADADDSLAWLFAVPNGESPDDGLLPAGCDLAWLTETATLLAHADTYLLLRRTTGWDIPSYQDWLLRTWTRLVASSAGPIGSTRRERKAPRRR